MTMRTKVKVNVVIVEENKEVPVITLMGVFDDESSAIKHGETLRNFLNKDRYTVRIAKTFQKKPVRYFQKFFDSSIF